MHVRPRNTGGARTTDPPAPPGTRPAPGDTPLHNPPATDAASPSSVEPEVGIVGTSGMAQLNLTMLGGVAALFSGGAGNRPGGTGTGNAGTGNVGAGAGGSGFPSSFNYSVLHGPGHVPLPGGTGTGNHSLLHFPPPDYSKLFGNVSGGSATNVAVAAVGGLLEGAYDLASNLTPCALANDTSGGAVVGLACNFSLLDNASAAAATTNATHPTGRPSPYTTIQLIVLAFLAGATCITTIVGNLIVILSFVIERTIRQPTNYFIASLAVSDLLIGTFSMPFYTIYLLTGKYWPLGEVLCDLWLSVDYTVCLTSIYTVFCITIDRFCSVKIPAKYRAWRTDNKVTGVIALTWVIPILVFFTSIFGWQYFVGRRTVPEGMCYVQYMEDALFNCVLQLGYFWVTLTVMCVLYTGIYKVALDLQRKSEAKQKKMTSLVSMAGQTMTKIGIGMSKHQKIDGKKLFERTDKGANKPDSAPKTLEPGHSTTSFNCKQDKDEDRSSSPAFPSDTDQSSQSPKHTKPLKSEGNNNNKGRNRKRQGKVKNADKKARRRDLSAEEPGLNSLSGVSPGLANSAYTETVENNNSPAPPIVGNSLINATRPFDVKRGSVGNHSLVRSPATSPISALSGGGCGGGGGGGGGRGLGGGGGGVVVATLPHNSVAPLPPTAPLTVDSVEAANILINPVINNNTSMEDAEGEPASPSSMENMPSESPPPYPAIFNYESCTPGLSEGDSFSFPPPPQGGAPYYNGSDAGSGVVSMRSGGVGGRGSGTTSPCSGRGVEGHRGSMTGSHNTMPSSPTTMANNNNNPAAMANTNIPAVAIVNGTSSPQPMSPTPTQMTMSAAEAETAGRAITTPPEFISGLKYIDQDSLKSPLSTDNIRFLSETGQPPPGKERDSLVVDEPDSPVWKRRSLVERETRGGNGGNYGNNGGGGNLVTTSYSSPAMSSQQQPCLYQNTGTGSYGSTGSAAGSDDYAGGVYLGGISDSHAKSSPSVHKDSSLTANHDSSANNSSGGHRTSSGAAGAAGSPPGGAHIQVESRQGDNSKTVSRLAKPDEIQPLNADDGMSHPRGQHGGSYISHGGGGGSGRRGKGKAGSPLRGLIKSVGSRKFKRKKEKQQKSKSENRARKALRVITIILGAFVLCWTPWHILSMIMGFCPDDSGCVEPTLYDISYWLCYLNSPINPLCYAFANQAFKKTFIRIIRLDWHRT